MTQFGTVDEPRWIEIQLDLARRGVIPWYWGLTPMELSLPWVEVPVWDEPQ